MFLSAILPYYNGILLMLMMLKNKVSPLLDKWGYCLNKRYKTFFKKHLTNVSICDKILWYCGATGYTVRLGQSEPCKIYQTLCGYGGIGRRVWFSLRYDSEKISVSCLCETVFCLLKHKAPHCGAFLPNYTYIHSIPRSFICIF